MEVTVDVLRLHHDEQKSADGSIIISNDLVACDQTTLFWRPAGVQTLRHNLHTLVLDLLKSTVVWYQPTADSMTCWFVHTALARHSSVRVSSDDEDLKTTIL